MSPQEALLKIKAMFAEAQATPEVAVANFAEYVLASGVKVMVDKLEVGGKVTLLDEAGNEVPAPAGEHTLADGSVIVLDETGTILEIKVPEVEVEIEAPESEVELMKKKVAEMEAQLEALKGYKKEAEVKMSENLAQMNVAVDNTVSTGIIPTRMAFLTTPLAGGLAERMRIDSNGSVFIGFPVTSGQNTGGLTIQGKDIELMTIMDAY